MACKNHGKFLNLTISVFSPFKVCVCVLFLKEQIFVFKVFFLSLSLIINYDTTQLFDVALGGLLDNSFFLKSATTTKKFLKAKIKCQLQMLWWMFTDERCCEFQTQLD